MKHEVIREFLDDLKSKSLLRSLPHYKGRLDFSSNDYLGLSWNTASLEAGIETARKFGTGSTGSRLLSGNPQIFEDFESQIARDKKAESALIFNSGFIANSSVVSAFAGAGYLMIFDKLNHASMYQFNFAPITQHKNATQLLRFGHLNYDQLEKILEEHKDNPRKFIASETVFGMDGDIADVERLSDLASKYGAVLYLDEAHATGLYGEKGYGISTNVKLNPENTIVMGTFSKSLASTGAYITCDDLFKKYLIQVSKGFIYSTALLPFCIGVAQYNWNLIPELGEIRKRIMDLSDYLRDGLTTAGLEYSGKGTNLVPVIFNSIDEMQEMHKSLLEANIITSAVRRPTSPTTRIKIAVNANHSKQDIDNLLEVMKSNIKGA